MSTRARIGFGILVVICAVLSVLLFRTENQWLWMVAILMAGASGASISTTVMGWHPWMKEDKQGMRGD